MRRIGKSVQDFSNFRCSEGRKVGSRMCANPFFIKRIAAHGWQERVGQGIAPTCHGVMRSKYARNDISQGVSDTGMRNQLHVLCYEHHVEMKLSGVPKESGSKSAERLAYSCQVAGCEVHYEGLRGYFLAEESANADEQSLKPRVRCSKDEQFMYLAEVKPERTSYRLWKCPECDAARTNVEAARA